MGFDKAIIASLREWLPTGSVTRSRKQKLADVQIDCAKQAQENARLRQELLSLREKDQVRVEMVFRDSVYYWRERPDAEPEGRRHVSTASIVRPEWPRATAARRGSALRVTALSPTRRLKRQSRCTDTSHGLRGLENAIPNEAKTLARRTATSDHRDGSVNVEEASVHSTDRRLV
jgi:hypothetical protein